MSLRRLVPLLPLALAGCGSPPPVPTTPPAPTLTVNTDKDPPVDVSPIPDPANLVVLARVSKPDAIMKVVGEWTHLPLPAGREMIRSVASDTIADVVDLSQPLDAAVTVSLSSRRGVEAIYAFSIGVKSFDDAKTRLGAHHKLVAVTNGSFKVHGLSKRQPMRAEDSEEDEDDAEADACVLAHAAAGAKLVCGQNAGVDALTPYLSRTMPRQSWPADVHIEVRPEPVRGPLQEMSGALPMLAHSILGTTSAAVNELVDASIGEGIDIIDDTQKLTIDATIGVEGVVGTQRIEFLGNKSVFARALTDSSRADPAPPAFWHLPADTDTAFFMRGSDAKLYDHPREILTNLLVEGMDSAALPPAEKKAVHDLVADKMLRLFTNGGTGIYAKGYNQAALENAVRAAMAVKGDDWAARDAAKRTIGEQVIGWHLYQVSEPVAKVGPILKDWSALWNRPTFTKWMESMTGAKAKEMPKMRIAALPGGVTLPKDTVHLEVTIPVDPPTAHMPSPPPSVPSPRPGSKSSPKAAPAPAPKTLPSPKPMVVHIFAVPDGANTWLAFGVDGKLVGTKVAQALSSAPDTNTLGKTVTGLDALKEKNNGGGMLTMRGLLVFTAFDAEERSPFKMLSMIPQKGTSPIVITSRAEPPSASARAGASVGTINVSRQVIEDIVKLAFASR